MMPYNVWLSILGGAGIVVPNYKEGSGRLGLFWVGRTLWYIDNFGIEVMPPSFEETRVFSEGSAATKVGGSCDTSRQAAALAGTLFTLGPIWQRRIRS